MHEHTEQHLRDNFGMVDSVSELVGAAWGNMKDYVSGRSDNRWWDINEEFNEENEKEGLNKKTQNDNESLNDSYEKKDSKNELSSQYPTSIPQISKHYATDTHHETNGTHRTEHWEEGTLIGGVNMGFGGGNSGRYSWPRSGR
jgi:hypothetical protein